MVMAAVPVRAFEKGTERDTARQDTGNCRYGEVRGEWEPFQRAHQ